VSLFQQLPRKIEYQQHHALMRKTNIAGTRACEMELLDLGSWAPKIPSCNE